MGREERVKRKPRGKKGIKATAQAAVDFLWHSAIKIPFLTSFVTNSC